MSNTIIYPLYEITASRLHSTPIPPILSLVFTAQLFLNKPPVSQSQHSTIQSPVTTDGKFKKTDYKRPTKM